MLWEIETQFIQNKLNLVIFNLTVDDIPERPLMRTFAQHLYAASDITIFLPTVKSALYKEPTASGKSLKLSEVRFGKYVEMMRNLIEDIQSVGNHKAYVGTIPLVPIKFARELIGLYASKGITCFGIDANTSDLFINETDLRAILSEINQHSPLSESLIYACNLGFPKYERSRARADDFLSIFAYVDLIGNTFKQKAFTPPPGLPVYPRLKAFTREDYSYHLLGQTERTKAEINATNQTQQLRETNYVKELLGQEKMKRYLETKSAIDSLFMGKLESIASRLRLS